MASKIVTIFDTDVNFWEANPQFKLALSFKDFYKKDRSKAKKDSSMTMWFIALTNDIASTFYNLPEDERYEVIGEDYMDNPKYYSQNTVLLEPLIRDYVRLTTTVIDRHLLQWDRSLEDRTKFLSTVKYDLENFDKLDKMNANTAGVFNNLKKIKEDLAKDESGSGDTKGGYKESLNDTGEI